MCALVSSKPALTESLEIDQYIWAILNTLSNTDVDEVVIDASANWRAVQGNMQGCPNSSLAGPNNVQLNVNNVSASNNNNANGNNNIPTIKQENLCDDISKVMSPGSTQLPTWDNSQAMSPYMSHDMNSIANGNMMGAAASNQV